MKNLEEIIHKWQMIKMLNQFYFYFHQGKTAIRKSILTLMALGIAISLVAGLNYYMDSYQTQALDENLSNISDYIVYGDNNEDDYFTSTMKKLK